MNFRLPCIGIMSLRRLYIFGEVGQLSSLQAGSIIIRICADSGWDAEGDFIAKLTPGVSCFEFVIIRDRHQELVCWPSLEMHFGFVGSRTVIVPPDPGCHNLKFEWILGATKQSSIQRLLGLQTCCHHIATVEYHFSLRLSIVMEKT